MDSNANNEPKRVLQNIKTGMAAIRSGPIIGPNPKKDVENCLAIALKNVQEAERIVELIFPNHSFSYSLHQIDLTLGARFEHWKAFCGKEGI